MKKDLVHSLTSTFEAHAQQTDSEIEFWLARDLQQQFGYTEWRNFEGVIKRAINIIKHKHIPGKIDKTFKLVNIGSHAKRKIVDYSLDRNAYDLVQELSSSYKTNNFYSIRNETIVLQLLSKYCLKKNIDFEYQVTVEKYRYDCRVANHILIEFDEPHHQYNTKQQSIDQRKNKVARKYNCEIFRIDLSMDIIDIIIYLEKHI